MIPAAAFSGAPVIVVRRGGFGFDPFEDLHHNMERAVRNHVESGGPKQLTNGEAGGLPPALDGQQPPMMPLEMQLASLFNAFGSQHEGHFGKADGGFEVHDEKTRMRITASLPGYNLKDDSGPLSLTHAKETPLSVSAVGRRSLVVKGMEQHGPLIRSWQRSFALPKGSDIDNIAITYSSSSGNLTVDVPRIEGYVDEEEDDTGDDDFLPPALKAMKGGMPGLLNALEGPQQPRRGGFLMPEPDFGDALAQALGLMSGMHPAFHPPAGGEKPLPEDAEVNLVGCFAEDQLGQKEIKYFGEANAASFNAMYWHARADHARYFAMSRHGEPLGHAFTAKSFAHEDEKPKWGVYDGCGSRCEDDDSRYCGCSNEGSRGFPNPNCQEGKGEKRFAVYKIKEPETTPGADAPSGETADGSTLAPSMLQAPVQGGEESRPHWQLKDSSDDPSIEVMIPKGMVPKAKGKEVKLYRELDVDDAGDVAEDAPPAGKVRLPVSVAQEDCDLAAGNSKDMQVLKCKLPTNVVKPLPIKVIDEL